MTKVWNVLFGLVAGGLVTVLLTACGGGGGGDNGSASSSTLVTGTVAQGGAMVGGTVTLRDSSGKSSTTTTASDGTYTIDVSSLVAPFVVIAVGNSSVAGVQSTLVSAEDVITASTTNHINVTPWTTAIAAMLSSTGNAKDLDPIQDKSKILSSLTLVDNYTKVLLAPTLIAAGYGAGQGPISTPFVANHTGYDSIYDNLIVGVTPKHAVFMAAKTSSPVYSDPPAQTTTNPNICGSDIATGAPIPCDSALPPTATPPVNSISIGSNPYTFGCIGCIFWGPADNFGASSSQTPLSLAGVVPPSSTGIGGGTGTGGGTGGGGTGGGTAGGSWFAHWDCKGQTQCIAVVGSNIGTAGPFASQSVCDAWRTTNFFGAFCNQSPT